MRKILKWILIFILPFLLFDFYKGICRYYANSSKNTPAPLNAIVYQFKNHYWHFPPDTFTNIINEEKHIFLVHSDKYGFRNNLIVESPTLLLLGDSFTCAVNTQDKDTYAQILTNEGLSVYNAGMDGTGTCHQAYILKDILDHIHPQIVVLNFYLGNDFHDNFFGPQLQTLKESLDSPLKKENLSSPTKNISDGKFKFFIIEHLRSIKDFIMSYSPSFKLIYDRIRPYFHEKTEMLYYDRSELKMFAYQEDKPDPDIQKSLENTEEALHIIQKIIDAYNKKNNAHVKLVVVGIPSKAQVIKSLREVSNFSTDEGAENYAKSLLPEINFDTPNRLLADICAKNNIPYFSLLPLFRENAGQELYYHFDLHWNWRGEKIAAQAVSKWLIELGLVRNRPS
ncbi:MAG: SGNH/GDSL hydrolase family protein [Proteobacteria bacterium]|nr:SGNH/GDSL hydrolase family protein [Pseudomonadota bacterium]